MSRKRADGEGTYYYDEKKDMWRYTVIVAGKNKSFSASGKGGKARAKEKYEKWKAERDGMIVSVSADMKLNAWMKMYLESYRKGTMKETSFHQLELLSNAITPDLKTEKMCDIKPIEIQLFLNTFSETASKSYVDKMSGLLKAAFDEAQENGLVIHNPTRKLKIPKKTEAPKQAYSAKEVETICNFAMSYHQNEPDNSLRKRAGCLTGAAIISLLLTGVRRGELLGLMWGDIGNGKIIINRAVYMDSDEGHMRPTVTEYEAKTNKSLRTIPLPPQAEKAMQRLPRRDYMFSRLKAEAS